MLLDSNVIIYFSNAKKDSVFKALQSKELYASVISKVEVLGFHNLTNLDKLDLQKILTRIHLLEISDDVIDKAVSLRQIKNISLGDSIIAATAIVHKQILVTANIKDFKWIKELEIINPLVT